MIEVDNLHRSYQVRNNILKPTRTSVDAVRGISFTVDRGELFGLLGPNGAGKTTTIKVLATLLLPSSGTVRVFDHDIVRHTSTVRRLIAYVSGGDRGLYDRLSALDNLRYFAELYGIPPKVQRTRFDELLELVGLKGRERERVEGYSRGMRQRLHIARGLLHDPGVLLLDEPTIGIDPVGARELRSTIAALTAVDKTVLLTTHYMFEADELCDRIAVIQSGKIVAQGTSAQLKERVTSGHVVEVETFGLADADAARLKALPGVRSVAIEERDQALLLNIQVGPGRDMTRAILSTLDGTRVGRIVSREPTLEDAYVELVNRR